MSGPAKKLFCALLLALRMLWAQPAQASTATLLEAMYAGTNPPPSVAQLVAATRAVQQRQAAGYDEAQLAQAWSWLREHMASWQQQDPGAALDLALSATGAKPWGAQPEAPLRSAPGAPAPSSSPSKTHLDRGLIIAGGTSLGAAWTVSVMVSINNPDEVGLMWLPLVGPATTAFMADTGALGTAGLFALAGAQVGGLVALLTGTNPRNTSHGATRSQMNLAPMAGATPGLALQGRW